MPSPASSAELRGDLTERLLRRFLWVCESPRTRRHALALVRGSVGNARAGKRFYALINRLVLNPVACSLGVPTSAVRVELVGAQLVGLAMLRYVLEVEPIASLEVDDLVASMAPALRAAMGGTAPVAPTVVPAYDVVPMVPGVREIGAREIGAWEIGAW